MITLLSLGTLERESQLATNWLKQNEMIVNPDKFHDILGKRNADLSDQFTVDIDGNQVTLEKSLLFIRVHIDQKLSFDGSFSPLCKKENRNSRLYRYLRFKQRKTIIDSFAYANFDYCHLI